MEALAHFFPQGALAPSPQPTPPPTDAGLLQRISKLVEFATRNGPSFVELIKTKQKASAPLLAGSRMTSDAYGAMEPNKTSLQMLWSSCKESPESIICKLQHCACAISVVEGERCTGRLQ